MDIKKILIVISILAVCLMEVLLMCTYIENKKQTATQKEIQTETQKETQNDTPRFVKASPQNKFSKSSSMEEESPKEEVYTDDAEETSSTTEYNSEIRVSDEYVTLEGIYDKHKKYIDSFGIAKETFEGIMADNITKLMKDINLHIQKVQEPLNTLKTDKSAHSAH